MSHCVPDWDGPGGELEAILATTDYFPPVVKGKWGSSPQKRADLSDLAPVRVVDAGQSQWNGEMIATQAAPLSRGRNNQWEGNCPNDDWSGGQETGDAVTPSKPLNYSSPPVVKESCLAVDVPVIDTAMNTSPHQEDEMVSWLQYPTDEPHYKLDEPQYPLDDSLESNYCSEFFGKLPNSNLANTQSVRDSLALAGQQSIPGGRSSRNSLLANNIGSLSRVASADAAMALGAGRAAGLLPQAGGVEAFTKVRTTMPQPKWSPNSSPNPGKYLGATSAPVRPPDARTPSVAPPLSSPMLTPNKSQAPVPLQKPARLGHMNFSHFSRPAVQMKANLQGLVSHQSGAGANRLKMSPLGGTPRPFDPTASSGSSIAESTTTRPSSGISGKESDVPVEGSEGQQQSLGGTETSWPSSSMQNSLSSKDTEPTAPSAGDNVEAGSQPVAETSENRPSSSVATGSEAPAGPDKSMSQAAPEVQDPAEATLTSSSGNSADRGKGVTSRGKKRAREDETECQSDVSNHPNRVTLSKWLPAVEVAEEEVIELKKTQQRGGTVKRTRAAEVHNLSERRRRDRINEKMKALQELIPNSNKADKASMLDEAIAYLKMLQVQLVDICRKSGLTIPSVIPTGMQHLQMPQVGTMLPPMGIGMGMSMGHMVGMGVLDCMAAGRPSHAIPHLSHGHSHSGSPLLPHISHGGPFSVSPMMPLPSHGAGGPSHSVSATSPAVSMGGGHDLRLPSNSALESAYRARQHALQINHPQAMDVYGAYMIHQHQLHHLANNMSGAPPHHLANNMSSGPPHHLQNSMSSGLPHHLPVNMGVGPPHHVPSNMSGGSPHHSGPPQHLPNMNCGPSHHLPNNMGGGGP